MPDKPAGHPLKAYMMVLQLKSLERTTRLAKKSSLNYKGILMQEWGRSKPSRQFTDWKSWELNSRV
jgi:hypothetical protein